MSDHVQQTIDEAIEKVRALEADIAGRKASVNSLCRLFGKPEAYSESETNQPSFKGSSSLVQRNAYFGKALASAMREYLEARESSGLSPKEATLQEIIDALKSGGFNFKGQPAEGVAISLGKNSGTFAKLPTGDYGLQSWYGVRRKKTKESSNGASSDTESDEKETIDNPDDSLAPDPSASSENTGDNN